MQIGDRTPAGWLRIVPVLIAGAAITIAATGIVLAQGGSVGGSIGKKGQSVSGSQQVVVPKRARPEPRPVNPRKSRAATKAAKPEARATRSLSGLWRWTGQCTRFTEPYTGTLTISQSGNTFSASHGGTNMWDSGTISNGRISGNRVSFVRTFGQYSDHLNLSLSSSGSTMRMAGTISTAHSGQCQMRFTKN
ncbi:hypothetical protein [Pseudorhodoplanes sp.]|uniref:hypothetical protein n=1 Tax=Pseudorhodoplanes sp. TaxID=1934341 RepID=UPI003D13B1F6